MPIRPDLKKFYGRAWREEIRPRILARAGGKFRGGDVFGARLFGYTGGAKCEQCGKPDRTVVYTLSGVTKLAPDHKQPFMFWVAEGGSVWRGQFGQEFPTFQPKALPRKIRVVIAVVHLNHTPGDDRDENLKALCQWCHLNWDALHHKETRSTRKDRSRPLLAQLQDHPSIPPNTNAL